MTIFIVCVLLAQAEFQYIESGLLFDVAGQELYIAQSAVSSQKEN